MALYEAHRFRDDIPGQTAGNGSQPKMGARLDRVVILAKARRRTISRIAAMGATEFGEIAVADAGGRYFALTPVRQPVAVDEFAAYVSGALLLMGIIGSVLVIQRGANGEAAASVYGGGDFICGTEWDSGWETLRDPATPDTAPVERFAHLAKGEANLVRLRELLTAARWPGDPLADLLAVLGHEPWIAPMVDGVMPPGGATHIGAPGPLTRLWFNGAGVPQAAAPTPGMHLLARLVRAFVFIVAGVACVIVGGLLWAAHGWAALGILGLVVILVGIYLFRDGLNVLVHGV